MWRSWPALGSITVRKKKLKKRQSEVSFWSNPGCGDVEI
jgi:hypothetical protein